MALRNAVMAALLEGEASGYDLAKGFDATVANFWMSTPQQLYRELERMEAEGLIAARVVEQERRPNKRLFSLTEAGRQAVRAYTAASPSRPVVIRDELLVKVQCADAGDVEAVRAAVAERMEWATAKLARYEKMRRRLLDGRSEEAYFTEAERIGPYLTLLRGMAFERENLAWGDMALRRLRQRAAADTP
ncbi:MULTISPECIES: PadR family transcriptional regulator [Streptomyces]|uniref:DNA-binding PadR family transcriptional regulator n=1 Tax=Streptomyces stelliscabiei TaxID=146820 RepID=A0A8I0TNY7_9ACTN|nr:MULTISPECIES: PadR family transcriptional regulator [Streptomyces]KND41462.1 PadR family transcriptional regulator [Streptomyces stelliscabiei]MBE1596255.1 DNA-binding PadR family transcriptional regulator [Streptomyces stelliscabiei]MDX2518070.1 PadR family transcriptional regulator [Streptomyces stelliscabiei]MDX2555690.1 PadR family transcriptional regulator [Streptomyces stelliscabiei]MDX2614323.1 PadR family transcriptional regulator [Streptomyces stelliscabiei]